MHLLAELPSLTKNDDNTSKNSTKIKEHLRFEPISSSLDPNFWFKVFQLKLEVDKLDEVSRPLVGYYNSKSAPFLTLDCSSFNQYVILFTYVYFLVYVLPIYCTVFDVAKSKLMF